MAYSAFQGSAFQIGSPLVAVKGVVSLPDIAQKKDTIDTTAINDLSETSITDPLQKYTEFELTINYDKADTQHTALKTAYQNATSVAGCLVMSDGESFTGTFLVLSFTPSGDRGTPARRKIGLKPTGTITISS